MTDELREHYDTLLDALTKEMQKMHREIQEMRAELSKTGKWIVLRDEYGDIVECVCSECSGNGREEWGWCPHCGMKMLNGGKGGKNDDKQADDGDCK